MSTLYELLDQNQDNDSIAILYINADSHIETQSYRQMLCAANVVESKIRQSFQLLAKNSVIGIYGEVNEFVPALMIGIMRADCAFACITPQRIRSKHFYLYSQALNYLICAKKSIHLLEKLLKINETREENITYLFGDFVILEVNSDRDLIADNTGESFAYLMTTSGTTGIHKLVYVPHACIVPNIVDLKREFAVTSADTLLVCSPFTFDSSIVDLYIGLSSGSRLLIVDNLIRTSSEKLLDIAVKFAVTYMTVTPSFWSRFSLNAIQNILLGPDTDLRVLVFGGERSPSLKLIRQYLTNNANRTSIYNIYGVTEVSAWASIYKFDANHAFDSDCNYLPIYGRNLVETEISVDDNNECFIISDKRRCLVVSFRDSQNGAQHRDHQWSGTHKTGDYARVSSDRNYIHFAGRTDHVIKINGKKVDMESIEAEVQLEFEVECVAVAGDWHHIDNSVAHLFVRVDSLESTGNRRKLLASISKYLFRKFQQQIAFNIVAVNCFPLTKHSKVDRIALSQQIFLFKSTICDELIDLKSRDNVKHLIINLLNRYLKIPALDSNTIEDINFKNIGGDSITALQFAIECETDFALEFPLLVNKMLNNSLAQVCEYIVQTVDISTSTAALESNSNSQLLSLSHSKESFGFKRKYEQTIDEQSCVTIITRRGSQTFGRLTDKNIDKLNHNIQLNNSTEIHNLEILWSIDMSQCVDASPLLVSNHSDEQIDHKVFAVIGSHSGLVMSVNITDGSVNWETQLDDRVEASAAADRTGELIFVGDYSGRFYCLSAICGKIVWSSMANEAIKCSPICSANLVFCGSHYRCLYAWNVRRSADTSQQLVWECRVSEASIFSSPILSANCDTVYVATLDGTLAAVTVADGLIAWKFSFKCPIFSSLTLVNDSHLLIGTTSATLISLDTNSRSISWTLNTIKPVFSSPFVINIGDRCLLYIGTHNCELLCADVSSGQVLWRFGCSSPVYSTPFVDCGYLVFAETSGALHLLDSHSGAKLCDYRLNGELFSSPVMFNNNIVVGCRDNHFYCFITKKSGGV